MQIVIRTDSSAALGHGHVMRCLALAERLRAGGAHVRFACLPADGDARERIIAQGFEVTALTTRESLNFTEQGFDAAVLDIYDMPLDYEQTLRSRVGKLFVIDDVPRAHSCDLLLDVNRQHAEAYAQILPEECQLFCGPEYVLLRGDFTISELPKDGPVYVSFGASQAGRAALENTLEALRDTDIPLCIVHPQPPENEIPAHWQWHTQAQNVAALMRQCSAAIGTAGMTMWERLAIGLPSITYAIHPMHVPVLEELQRRNHLCFLGDVEALEAEPLTREVDALLAGTKTFAPCAVSTRVQEVVDALLNAA